MAREIDQLYEMERKLNTWICIPKQKAQVENDWTKYYVITDVEVDRVSQNYLSNTSFVRVQSYEQLVKERKAIHYQQAMENHQVPYPAVKEHYELSW